MVELICNVQEMEEAVLEMKYDSKKAPLGTEKLRNLNVAKESSPIMLHLCLPWLYPRRFSLRSIDFLDF